MNESRRFVVVVDVPADEVTEAISNVAQELSGTDYLKNPVDSDGNVDRPIKNNKGDVIGYFSFARS